LRPESGPSIRYINRELSWLEFNRRVLAEASSTSNPLLERLRFLAIFESNLDEFYMVRVSGLIEQFESGVVTTSPDGLTPTEQLVAISKYAEPLRNQAAQIFEEQIRPQLLRHGVHIRRIDELTDKQREEMSIYFQKEIFPLCTPLVMHPAPSFPFISSRSLNLAVELTDGDKDVRLLRVKIPTGTPRFIRLGKRKHEYLCLEELISANLAYLFPGVEVLGAHLFRVIRDADVEIRELDAADLITSVEETMKLRRFGDPVLMQCEAGMPDHVRTQLMSHLKLDEEDVFKIDGILGMESLLELVKMDKPALRFPPHVPFVPDALSTHVSLFDAIAQADILVHHPYDGFRSVEEFVGSAEKDPSVVGIKQTLYRVGPESPIVESLLGAAGTDKQVAALVELKARFDEINNVTWARALERAGVHVTYGFKEMKTHCKLGLIVRREAGGMKQYAHIGTGNYNPSTARIYTDLGLFTCDPDLTQDIGELFNYLTGYSKQTRYRKLLVAPLNLREGILERIYREAQLKENGRIILKLNALVDPEIIEALYEASGEGVEIDLIVRGVCCLRPQVPGMSDRIRVVSIVGRFLEHSRVYYFGNGGQSEILIGSADCMRRNLDRRIEVLAPVENTFLQSLILEKILMAFLQDNVRAWVMDSDGCYSRKEGSRKERRFDSQSYGMLNPLGKYQFAKS
jgi:polyphosphate kinase